MNDSSIGLAAYAAALPALRLPADAYKTAWGSCAARGLKRKAFCAYDEDPVTLAVAAARGALGRLEDGGGAGFDALFLGATTLPYEEKPAAATVLTALTARRDVRVVEIGGSPQAGLQALAAAWEFCAARPGRRALAVAADAPTAPPDMPYEHALGAGAAAFLVVPGGTVATFRDSAAVSRETFGARLRRRGEPTQRDLELRTDDLGPVVADLAAALGGADAPDRAAVGGDPGAVKRCQRPLKLPEDAVSAPWPELGDAGAATAPLALVDALDRAAPGEDVLAVALGAGATALRLQTGSGLPAVQHRGRSLADLAAAGREVDYLAYLRHRRLLSSRFGGTA